MSDARPVWLTRETVTLIEIAARTPWYGMPQVERDALMVAVKAWDAAPADPTQAVRDAVALEWMNTGMGNEERIDSVYDREGAAIYRANAVLRALGFPAGRDDTP